MRRRQPQNPYGNIIENPLEASKSGTSVPVIDLTSDDEERPSEETSTSQHVTSQLRKALAERMRQTSHRYTNYQHFLQHPQPFYQPQRPYHHHLRNPYQPTPLPLWGMPTVSPKPSQPNVLSHPPIRTNPSTYPPRSSQPSVPSHPSIRTNSSTYPPTPSQPSAPSHPSTRTNPPTPSNHVQHPPPTAHTPSNQINTNVPRTIMRWTDREDSLLRNFLRQIPTPYHLVEPLLPHRTRSAIIQRIALLRSEERQRVQQWHSLRELGRQALRERELIPKPTQNLHSTDNVRQPQTIAQTPNPPLVHPTETELAAKDVRDDSSDDDGLAGERRLAELLGGESSDEDEVKEERVTNDKLTESRVTQNKVTENKIIENKVTDNKATESKVAENKATENKLTESKVVENKVAENELTESKVETEELEFVFVAPGRDQQQCQKFESMVRDDFCGLSERRISDLQPRKREYDTAYDRDKKRVKKDELVVERGA